MKIAITTDAIYPYTVGGSEIRIFEIGKRLVRKGHEVHIFGKKLWPDGADKEIEGVKIHGFGRYSGLYNNSGKRKTFDQLKLSISIFGALAKEKFDIIDNQSFVYPSCFLTKIISVIKKEPLVFTWHQYFGKYLINYFGPIKGCAAMALERLSLGLTDKNIAVSTHVKSELVRRGLNENKIRVIYNGADIELAKNIGEREKIYDLIFVGRLNYQKNLPLLVKMTDILKSDFPEIKVCIIGDGGEQEKIKKLVKESGLENNFSFLGRIDDRKTIFTALKSSKIFILPSLLEGFPLVIVEANACGLPVVATNTEYSNVKEYIKDRQNGLITSPFAKDMAEAAYSLLRDKPLYEKMSAKSQEMSESFDWDRLADQKEKYYLESINNFLKR